MTNIQKLEGMLFQLGFTDLARERVIENFYKNPQETYREIIKQYLGMLNKE